RPADEPDRPLFQFEIGTDATRDHQAEKQTHSGSEVQGGHRRVRTNSVLTREDKRTETICEQIARATADGPDDNYAENRRDWRVTHDVRPAFAHVGPVTGVTTLRLRSSDFSAFLSRLAVGNEPDGVRRHDERRRVDDECGRVTNVRCGPTAQGRA